MDMSDICPTEDAVLALLEYLVNPMLPEKSSLPDNPSQSLQQAIAKQVHAVLVLYNYYHRKQNPALEYLGFDSFCKLAVILKPALLGYLKFMQISNDKELNDPDNQLSIMEKTIMQACDISKVLDASKENPNVEEWPITKVAVFLVDSKEEKCLLLSSSITQGVWSVIEKDVEVLYQSSNSMNEIKQADKKRRVIRKPSRVDSKIDLAGFQQLACSAVEEVTGVFQTDLKVLEDRVIYSLSKEKEASWFYIIQCTKPVNDGAIQVPIKDAIDSLQGPLLEKSSGGWIITPVVEYFHVLPYAGILSKWMHTNLQDLMLEESSPWMKSPSESAIHKVQDKTHVHGGTGEGCNTTTTATNLKSAKERDKIGVSNMFGSPWTSQINKQCSDILNAAEVENYQKMPTSNCTGHGQASCVSSIKSLQLRSLQDNIAGCDRKIQTIMNGGDNDFALKIESIIEDCNDVCLSVAEEGSCQFSEDQLSSQYNKRKRFPDARLSIQNPCQELDAVCHANHWILPTYHLCPAEGGFRANVTIKGVDFDCSSERDLHSNPREARESAAALILRELQSQAAQAQYL